MARLTLCALSCYHLIVCYKSFGSYRTFVGETMKAFATTLFVFSFFQAMANANCLDNATDPHKEFIYSKSQNDLSELQTCSRGPRVVDPKCMCFSLAADQVDNLLNSGSSPVIVNMFVVNDSLFAPRSGTCVNAMLECKKTCESLASQNDGCQNEVVPGLSR
jgi:hypothetical protein